MEKRCVLVIFAVLVMTCIFTNAYAKISEQERAALIALYNSTNGDSWTDNSGWETPDGSAFTDPGTENTWYGVGCDDGNTMVEYLDLGSNQLTGSIPPQLGDLDNLQDLDLGSNQLTGSIPKELGNMDNLLYLWLDNNQLTGSIPPQLGDLNNLLELNLYHNQLTGSIPPQLGNLDNLKELDLGSNQLTGSIPKELGNMDNLLDLWLDDNQLCEPLPVELMNFTYLAFIDFCNNYLYTDNADLRDFLNTKQEGGDWEGCQNTGDLSSYAAAYGTTNADSGCNGFWDYDADGDVDASDLAVFASRLE